MQVTSEDWGNAQKQIFLPPSQIEVTLVINDETPISSVTANDYDSESVLSQVVNSDLSFSQYDTAELNKWVLDGNNNFIENTNVGYISNSTSGANKQFQTPLVLTINFSQPTTTLIKGLTVTFSKAFQEYASNFSVAVYKNTTLIGSQSYTDNTDITKTIDIENLIDYNKIVITINDWCLPNSKARIENVYIGERLVFNGEQLTAFSHEQSNDLLTLELPKRSINFSLDNLNGQFDIDNPQGLYKYLAIKQKVRARYGYVINGVVEWIECGKFYLDEWSVTDDEQTASFTAVDTIHSNMGDSFDGTDFNELAPLEKTYTRLAQYCFEQCGITNYNISSSLSSYVVRAFPKDFNYTYAEVLQMCVFLLGAVVTIDRNNFVEVKELPITQLDYHINRDIQYQTTYSLQKELKQVQIEYVDIAGDYEYYKFPSSIVNVNGELQTFNFIDNPLTQLDIIGNVTAQHTYNLLQNRKLISGQFRPDIALDVLDNVYISTKYYSHLGNFFITYLRFDYDLGFTGEFEGRFLENINE